MAKVRREEVLAAALALLDEVGLEDLTTRRLAERLGVESASLYWHFRDKAALLTEMAAAALGPHRALAVPAAASAPRPADALAWFAENARSFRRALLAHRDGARLHAGTTPGDDDLPAIDAKVRYLVRAGLPRRDALLALYSAGQFTLGCVLEEQARASDASISGEAAFEFGLGLLVEGLRARLRAARPSPPSRRPAPR
jgi:TetR/AcrR family tetracycline transcriptional repressor